MRFMISSASDVTTIRHYIVVVVVIIIIILPDIHSIHSRFDHMIATVRQRH